MTIQFSVFTKNWGKLPVEELGSLVSSMGFDGIEFPLRPGFQVEPANAEIELPGFVEEMKKIGLKVFSVASDYLSSLDEGMFAACAASEIPLIRTVVDIDEAGFHASIARCHKQIERLLPLSRKYGVTIGIQNHIGHFIPNAAGLLYFLKDYDPRHVAAIWDAAHNAMGGEEPEIALSAILNHTAMVNLKNAFPIRMNESRTELEEAKWEPYWTTGRKGLASWRRVISYLKRHNYHGVICLTAEYSDEHLLISNITEDIRYARSLFNEKEL